MTWKTAPLCEVTELITRGISPIYSEENGIIILNQKCIRNHEVSLGPARKHDSVAKAVKEDRKLKYGDVLVNSTGTGTLGRVAQILSESDEEVTVDSHVTIIRPYKELFYLPFFGYMLIAIEDQLKAAGEGASGQTELRRTAVANEFLVSYPTSKVIQQKIVAKLDAIFAGIDKASAANEANTKNAEALFQSYLTEVFESGGEGWKPTRLKDFADYFNGLTYSPKNVQEVGTVVLRSSNVQKDKILLDDIVRVDSVIKDKIFVRDGDILMCSRNGSKRLVGKTATIKNLNERMTFGTFMMVIRSESNFFIEWFFKSDLFKKQISSGENTMINQITRYMLDEIVIPLPDLIMQKVLSSKLATLYADTQRLQLSYQKKILSLNSLKQSILQQAFNGELVKD